MRNDRKFQSLPSIFFVLILVSGSISADHGGDDHLAWWLNVPSTAYLASYTVSFSGGPGIFLEEKYESGTYVSIPYTMSANDSEPESVTFLFKPAGTYTYRIRWDFCMFTCFTRYTAPQSIFISGTPPPPPPPPPTTADSLADQTAYVWEARAGDFNQDGHTDLLLDRLTAGTVDGTLHSTILEGNGTGLDARSPTESELSSARSYPQTTEIEVVGTDLNVDGYLDLFLTGLDSLGSTSFPEDELLIFASGVEPQLGPSAVRFIDQLVLDYWGAIREGLADPDYFIDNANTTIRPVFAIFAYCPIGSYTQPFYLFGCEFEIRKIGYVVQITGTSYPIQSLTTASKLYDIADVMNWQAGEQNHFKILSDAFRQIFGVPMFGYTLDGSRMPTNYRRGSDTEASEIEELGRFVLSVYRLILSHNDVFGDPIIWLRHEYDVNSPICLLNQNTTVIEATSLGPTNISTNILTIPAARCTTEQVYCWKRKRPAPRSIFASNIGKTVYDGEESLLQGFPLPNPIVTWLPAYLKLVNETLEGHIFHDPLAPAGGGCADKQTYQEINGPDPGSRCSYVFRQTYVPFPYNAIRILTHGEGYNEFPFNKVNEAFGEMIFSRVDAWIQRRLAEPNACVDDPPS